MEKPASPAPVAAPNAPISPQYGNNRTVIIQQRTYNSGRNYAVPYNPGDSQPNTGYNQQPAVNPGDSQPNTGYNQQPAVNPAPISTENNSDNAQSSLSFQDGKLFWFWLFVAVGSVALIAYCIYYYLPHSGDKNKKPIFSVTKLQVAMLIGSCPGVQSQLTELALNSHVGSAAERAEFLQESVLIVLRSRANWTHVCGTLRYLRVGRTGANIQSTLDSRTQQVKCRNSKCG